MPLIHNTFLSFILWAMKIDYQIQTTASDGKFSPRECVKIAKENGVLSIAITDHDTVGGIPEALEAGKEFGVEVIPGIELSTSLDGQLIHILGFGIDHKRPELVSRLAELNDDRDIRARLIIEKLQELGFNIDFAKVKARASGVVARPHIAEELLENPANKEKLAAEGINTKQDVFDKYIGGQGKAFIHRVPLTISEAIRLIHDSGGVAIWSHPVWPKPATYDWIEETLRGFIDLGIDGLETLMYTDEDDIEFLHTLAEKYNMLRTAGSDFHDLRSDPEHPELKETKIGGYPTYGYSTDGIREALLGAIEKRKETSCS